MTHYSPSRIGRSISFARSADQLLSRTKLLELIVNIRVANFQLCQAAKKWIGLQASIAGWEKLVDPHDGLSLRKVARGIFLIGQRFTQGTTSLA
jgi:hypothetical protein